MGDLTPSALCFTVYPCVDFELVLYAKGPFAEEIHIAHHA